MNDRRIILLSAAVLVVAASCRSGNAAQHEDPVVTLSTVVVSTTAAAASAPAAFPENLAIQVADDGDSMTVTSLTPGNMLSGFFTLRPIDVAEPTHKLVSTAVGGYPPSAGLEAGAVFAWTDVSEVWGVEYPVVDELTPLPPDLAVGDYEVCHAYASDVCGFFTWHGEK